jgi:fumarylacetoacetase
MAFPADREVGMAARAADARHHEARLGPRTRYACPMPTNATHDANLKSWVESANDPRSDFPIQNLPLCAFVTQHNGHSHAHLGVAIGDSILDVSMLAETGFFDDGVGEGAENLRRMLHMPFWDGVASTPGVASYLRQRVQAFLNAETSVGQQGRRLRAKALVPLAGTPLIAPMRMFNYSDFYASIHHATTVGSMFRPDHPLLPNYKHVPIGYHGRASSIVVSGAEVRRPRGQRPPPDDQPSGAPTFGPCTMLDYELEVGVLVGAGSRMGEPIPIAEAPSHMLGICLVNDWSARDIQKWEYQPLGPFLAKNFATTVSPFIVTMEALEPFRCAACPRPEGDPAPLPYLVDESDRARGGIDLTLEVRLSSAQMREKNIDAITLSKSGAFKEMYWSFAQMLAHHTSNGCNVLPGDLLACGTVSGREPSERGCMLELTWAGRGSDGKPLPRKPVELPTGEKRTFLQDDDEVIMTGYAEREGFRRIGLGECRGVITPAIEA